MKNFLALINKIPVVPLLIALFAGMILGNLLLFISPLFAYRPIFLFLTPAVCIFFLCLLLKPKEVFISLLFLRPVLDLALDTTKINFAGTQLSAGAGLNLAVIFLALFWSIRSVKINENPFQTNWFCYLIFLFIAIMHTEYVGTGIRLLINNFTYFAMYIIPFLLIKTRHDFKFFLKIVAASFVLPIVFGNIDMIFWGGRYFPDSGQRIAGSFAHPNILAFFMAFGIVIYFYILQSKLFIISTKMSLFLKALMLNMFILLLATKTRNAWIACLLCFLVYGFLRDRKLLLSLLILIPMLFFIPSVKQRVLNIVDPTVAVEYQGINSFAWRLEMWKSSLSMIKKEPFFGYGLTSFKPMTAQFSTVGQNGAHNVYLELMFETGLGGVLSFFALLTAPAIWFFRKMQIEGDPVLSRLLCLSGAYVVSYIIVCSADNMLYYLALNWYVWFFIGMIVAGYPFLRDQRNA